MTLILKKCFEDICRINDQILSDFAKEILKKDISMQLS